MPGISVIAIAKNEERNIGRMIESVRGLADEIIVVDGGSTDKTVEISESLGGLVIAIPWQGYGKTKNEGSSHAKSEYIFFLDADESLSPELRSWLIANKANLSGAYRFRRLTNYCGRWIRHGGWYPGKKLRLVPRGTASWDHKEVHETLLLNKDCKISCPPGNILHHSYYTFEEHRVRTNKYAMLAAIELSKKNQITLRFKKWLSPPIRFLQTWIFGLGFLDGNAGWMIAKMTAWEGFLKHREALRLKTLQENGA